MKNQIFFFYIAELRLVTAASATLQWAPPASRSVWSPPAPALPSLRWVTPALKTGLSSQEEEQLLEPPPTETGADQKLETDFKFYNFLGFVDLICLQLQLEHRVPRSTLRRCRSSWKWTLMKQNLILLQPMSGAWVSKSIILKLLAPNNGFDL